MQKSQNWCVTKNHQTDKISVYEAGSFINKQCKNNE